MAARIASCLTENFDLSSKQSEHPDNTPDARSLSQHTQFSARLPPERERHAQPQEMHAPAAEEEQIRSEPCGT
jgi:hypothetical protein